MTSFNKETAALITSTVAAVEGASRKLASTADTLHAAGVPSTHFISPKSKDGGSTVTPEDFDALNAAIVAGFTRIGPWKVLLVGHQKGRTTPERIACRFGCANPEGYRKALLKMKLAEKFKLPIVTLVDTPGAYPGIDSEQRGQAEAIAVNLREMSRLRTPVVTVVIGEGGSGGALGIAIADRVAMLENAWYSVISPEGCAAILWKEANERTNPLAAKALALTAKENLANGLIDHVIREPVGGAHRNPKATAASVQAWIIEQLSELTRLDSETLVRRRYEKFRRIGSASTKT